MNEPREGAFTILAPKGWKGDGGIFRINPLQAGGPLNSMEAKCDLLLKSGDRGTVAFRILPEVVYALISCLNRLFTKSSRVLILKDHLLKYKNLEEVINLWVQEENSGVCGLVVDEERHLRGLPGSGWVDPDVSPSPTILSNPLSLSTATRATTSTKSTVVARSISSSENSRFPENNRR